MYYDRLIDIPLPKYKQAKIRLLQDFDVFLSTEQKKHLETLQSEIAVDNYCRQLRDKRFNKLTASTTFTQKCKTSQAN